MIDHLAVIQTLYNAGYCIHEQEGMLVHQDKKDQPIRVSKALFRAAKIRIDGKKSRALWFIMSSRFKISCKEEDFVFVYCAEQADGCRSCMTPPSNAKSVAAYASGDINIAFIFDRERSEIVGRAICNAKTKQYSRFYGDSTVVDCLEVLGYTRKDHALEGCRLKTIFESNMNILSVLKKKSLSPAAIAESISGQRIYIPYIDATAGTGPSSMGIVFENFETRIVNPKFKDAILSSMSEDDLITLASVDQNDVLDVLTRANTIQMCEVFIEESKKSRFKKPSRVAMKNEIVSFFKSLLLKCREDYSLSVRSFIENLNLPSRWFYTMYYFVGDIAYSSVDPARLAIDCWSAVKNRIAEE